MTTLSRRKLLAVLGGTVGFASVAGGGYWLRRRALGCHTALEATHGYTNAVTDIWSEPVFTDGRAYVSEGTGIIRMSSDSRQFRLIALDDRGEPQWITRLDLEGGIGRPLITEDQVVAPTGGNTLVSCDRETGRVQWTLNAGNNDDGHMSSIAVDHDDHVLVVTNDPDAHGLSGGSHLLSVSTSGEIEWTTEVDEVSRGLTLREGLVVVATRDGTVASFEPETADQQWSTDLDGAAGWQSTPVWFGNHLWIPRGDGLVNILDPEDGIPQTQFGERIELDDDTLSNVTPIVVVDDERLLMGNDDGSLTAYDLNLTQQWEYNGSTQIAAIDTVDTRIAVLDQRGQYTELDAETGEAHRSFLLAVRQRDDWCGFDPSSERFRGLAVMSRQSIVATGRMFGTQFFRLPRRER